jgi:hypothetical protein
MGDAPLVPKERGKVELPERRRGVAWNGTPRHAILVAVEGQEDGGMHISAPAIQWPTELYPAGPRADPAIVLNGDAEVSGVRFRIMAIRMREGYRSPDYKEGVPRSAYESTLDSMADDIEDLIGSLGHALVTLNGAQYLLWMVPAARD